MHKQMNQVREFHESRDIAPMQSLPLHRDGLLHLYGKNLVEMSKELESMPEFKEDPRYLRAHLMMEELGELISAMACGDVVEVADGLADTQYVLVGTAVQFDFPLPELFEEVHRSNMSKAGGGASDPRLRDKGAGYQPPRIREILRETQLYNCVGEFEPTVPGDFEGPAEVRPASGTEGESDTGVSAMLSTDQTTVDKST